MRFESELGALPETARLLFAVREVMPLGPALDTGEWMDRADVQEPAGVGGGFYRQSRLRLSCIATTPATLASRPSIAVVVRVEQRPSDSARSDVLARIRRVRPDGTAAAVA